MRLQQGYYSCAYRKFNVSDSTCYVGCAGRRQRCHAGGYSCLGPKGNRGSHAQHVALLDARKVVEENIRNLNDYVDGISAGDAGMILSAGMVVSANRSPIGVLPAPLNFRSPFSKQTMTGQTRLTWDKVNGAKMYLVYTAATPTDPFVFIGIVSKGLFIASGAAGRLAYYTIRAAGTAGLGIETTPLAAYSAF